MFFYLQINVFNIYGSHHRHGQDKTCFVRVGGVNRIYVGDKAMIYSSIHTVGPTVTSISSKFYSFTRPIV